MVLKNEPKCVTWSLMYVQKHKLLFSGTCKGDIVIWRISEKTKKFKKLKILRTLCNDSITNLKYDLKRELLIAASNKKGLYSLQILKIDISKI